ncbi:MAG: GNAT family protein [Candidatus Riflebacteria bacterium]|nr:GNAT family protein [Candidatus Riflebacteria bacterium]
MNKKPHSLSIFEMLQKPVEIFAGLMPLPRCLFANRLYLRRCQKFDAPEFLQLLKKNRLYLSEWLQPQPDLIRIEDVQKMIAEDHKLARKGLRLDLGIFSLENDSMIGRIALHSVDYGIQRSAGLSYWLDEKLTGQGLIKEALATLTSFAFEEACLHRVWLNIINNNLASLAVARRLGFKNEGTLRQSLFVNGAWRDSTYFAMLEDDYDNLADTWIKKKYLGM